MAVAVETKSAFRLGTPRPLFRNVNIGLAVGEGTPWDISPDGKRFLMIKPLISLAAAPAPAGSRKINIVINWFEELKRKAPVK
jgi:hypothetical protein